jgi:hypothetical protein
MLMKTQGRQEHHLAHPMTTSSRCQRRGGMGVAGAANMRMLPILLHASAGKSTSKQTVEASTGGSQLGIAAQQLKRGK